LFNFRIELSLNAPHKNNWIDIRRLNIPSFKSRETKKPTA